MNRLEYLMSKYPQLKFVYSTIMPEFQGATIYKNRVYINENRSYRQNLQDVAEEIGHYETTVGDISRPRCASDRQQEVQARRYGYMLLVDLDSLIACYKNEIKTPWELADFFECNVSYIWKAIDAYRLKYGESFDYKGYRFSLNGGFNMEKIK